MNTTQQGTRKTRSRTLTAAVIALTLCLFVTGIIAYAARWFQETDKTDNTVTVDEPMIVSVSGAASSGIIMPGLETSKVTTTFDISVSGESTSDYKLVIKDIKFTFDPAIFGNERADGEFNDTVEFTALFGAGYTDFLGTPNATAFAAFLKEFQVSFNGGAAADLVEGMTLNPDAVTATGQTVEISATDDLLFIARGGTLTFTLALVLA